MQIEDYQEHWDNQPCDEIVSRGRTIVEADTRRRVRATMMMLAFFVLSVVSAVHFFWASFFVRQEGIWIALTRCSLYVVLAVVQLVVWTRLRREHARREACVLSQRRCLGRLVDDLNREIRDLSPLHAAVPLALISCFIAASKWIDFRLGHDSAAECIAITIVATLVMCVLPIGMWHYQQQFLIPRRDHIRGVLASLNAENHGS